MKTLLIVDDEADIREVIKDTLMNLGLQIDEAENGLEATKLLENKRYDAILSDINMPKMNGIEFLKYIRSENIPTPFVILTAYGDKDLAIQALKLGAFDFIDKPWQLENMVQTVLRALDLGFELNRWVAGGSELSGIAGLDSGATADESRLLKSLQLLSREAQELRKKNEIKK